MWWLRSYGSEGYRAFTMYLFLNLNYGCKIKQSLRNFSALNLISDDLNLKVMKARNTSKLEYVFNSEWLFLIDSNFLRTQSLDYYQSLLVLSSDIKITFALSSSRIFSVLSLKTSNQLQSLILCSYLRIYFTSYHSLMFRNSQISFLI